MSSSNKYASTLVVHQDSHRDTSVGSWASRSSYQATTTNSSASSESSYRGSVRDERSRDPSTPAKGKHANVKERSGHRGKVVVVNHHSNVKQTKEPTPSYSHASTYGSGKHEA